jgi:glycosyltransferase involved in cell wall biosynthesis
MSELPLVSFVIPVYNEEELIGRAIREMHEQLGGCGFRFEILICENGSIDRTRQEATALKDLYKEISLLVLDSPDYGGAMKTGFLHSNGGYIFNCDLDYFDIEFVRQAVQLLSSCDIVVGSKTHPMSDDQRPFVRRLATSTLGLFLRLLFGLKVTDTHGIKGFRAKAVLPLVKACWFGQDIFDTELLIRSERAGLRIDELPVAVAERRPARSSILLRTPRTILNLLRLRIILALGR